MPWARPLARPEVRPGHLSGQGYLSDKCNSSVVTVFCPVTGELCGASSGICVCLVVVLSYSCKYTLWLKAADKKEVHGSIKEDLSKPHV
jgi:hypothetical protein